MKSYILLQTAAIFFLSTYLKQGIGSVYVMADFICKGCLELSGTQVERELQNEKFLLTVGFEPWAFRLRSEGATTELQRLMFVEDISPDFNCAIFRKHLLRYWPILARSLTLHFAGAVNIRQKITVHIINLVYSEFPNRFCRIVRSFISTLNCT